MAKVKKKTAKKKAASGKKPRRAAAKKAARKEKVPKHIGVVTHFYNEIGVAIVKFNKKVPVGAVLYFKGATTDFKDKAGSMQYDHKPIAAAPKGKEVGIKVKKRVREGDKVHFAK